MTFAMSDLEALRTPEEYATYLGELDARTTALDAEFAGKAFSDEARGEWATIDEIRKRATATKTELEARRDAVAKLVQSGKGAEPAFSGRTIVTPSKGRRVPEDIFALEQYRNLSSSQPEMLQAYRDGAMFAVERSGYPHPQSKPEVEQAHIQTLLDHADLPSPWNPDRELSRRILATGSPGYLRAFTEYLRTGRDSEMRAYAPLTVQTDATGGYAVPFYFDPTLLHVGAWTNVNPYRRACSVKTIVGTDTFHGVTITAALVTRAAEAASVAEGGPATVGQISAIVGKVHGVVTLTMELLQDRPDITSEIASLLSEAKDTEEENIFTLGVGDALGAGFNPIGMLPPHTTSGAYTHMDTIAAAGAVAKEDLYAVEAALPIRYRSNAAWFLGRSEIRVFQALETTGGILFGGTQYPAVGTIDRNPVGNTGLRLLGYPIWEVPSAPAFVAATDDLVIGALVDPSSYYVIERAGMSVEVIPHFFDTASSMPTGKRAIYAWWRNTAKPANVDAGRRLALLA